jgi:LTXXQ motif family protein
MMPSEHVEGRIAFLKTELGITEGQLPQWDAFADALRTSAKTMHTAMENMHGGMPATMPAKLDAMTAMMTARLDALKTTAAAAKSLYAVLTDAQKKTADELVMSPMGGM